MTDDELTTTPRYLMVMQAAHQLARAMGHAHLGTEHVFLATIRDPRAVPTQILGEFVDVAAVDRRLNSLMTSGGYSSRPE